MLQLLSAPKESIRKEVNLKNDIGNCLVYFNLTPLYNVRKSCVKMMF